MQLRTMLAAATCAAAVSVSLVPAASAQATENRTATLQLKAAKVTKAGALVVNGLYKCKGGQGKFLEVIARQWQDQLEDEIYAGGAIRDNLTCDNRNRAFKITLTSKQGAFQGASYVDVESFLAAPNNDWDEQWGTFST
jgi:hypothetical protein